MTKIEENNKYKRLFKDTGLFAISNFASKILIFLLTPFYTSLMSTTEYGTADLINTTVNLVYPILTLAITDATLRFAMDQNHDKEKVLSNSLLIILLSVILLLIIKPIICLINDSLDIFWLYFVLIYLLFNIHNCLSNYIKAIGKTGLFALQGLIQTVILVACNIVFLLVFRMGLNGYLLSIVIAYIPPIIVMLLFGRTNILKVLKKGVDKKLLFEMFKYSIPMIPAIMAWFVNSSIDKYMIINSYGISENGIYSVAHKIPTIITTVITIFVSAWTLSSIQNHGSEDESEYTSNIYNALNFLIVFSSIIIIAFDKYLSLVLFAKDYYVAWKYVPFLIISGVFSSLSGFLAGPYRAAKKTMSLLVSVIVGAVINIILNIVLLNWLGVIGASIATATSFFIVWLLRIILIQKIVVIKNNVLVSLVSYILLLLSAVIVCLDLPYALIICLVFALITFFINYKSAVQIVRFAKMMINKRKISS